MTSTAHPLAARARSAGAALVLALLAACSTTAPPKPVVVAPPVVAEPAQPVISAKMAAAMETLSKMAALQERLYRVAAPLLVNNAELCKNQARNLLGFTAKNRYSYPGEFNEAARAALGLEDRLEVTGVLTGSGAARAGLRKGDGLLAAEGKPLPSGPNAETAAAGVFGPLVANHAALKLTIMRDATRQDLTVPVTRACAIRVDLGNSDNVNAYADGQRVMVTRGMLHFAQSDEELAYVMAKDMAHTILGHAASQRQASTIGSMIENLANIRPDLSMLIGTAGLKPMPQELDAQADTLALYLLVRAGYGIDSVHVFWKRLAASYPATVLNGYVANHPGTAHRLAAIDKGVAEIKSKQAAKKPLVP